MDKLKKNLLMSNTPLSQPCIVVLTRCMLTIHYPRVSFYFLKKFSVPIEGRGGGAVCCEGVLTLKKREESLVPVGVHIQIP
jgi:hypothetical protein